MGIESLDAKKPIGVFIVEPAKDGPSVFWIKPAIRSKIRKGRQYKITVEEY